MIITGPYLEKPLSVSSDKVTTLIIESVEYRAIVLSKMLEHAEFGGTALSLFYKGEEIGFKDNVEVIFNPFSLTPNCKRIQSGAITELKHIAVDEHHHMQTNDCLTQCCRYLSMLSGDLDILLELDHFLLNDLLKTATFAFREDYSSLVERICSYLGAAARYTKTKLFIFVNLFQYLSESDYSQFIREMCMRKYHILLIESGIHSPMEGEEMTVVDNDLCEITNFVPMT